MGYYQKRTMEKGGGEKAEGKPMPEELPHNQGFDVSL
jgi:hypothetical protein